MGHETGLRRSGRLRIVGAGRGEKLEGAVPVGGPEQSRLGARGPRGHTDDLFRTPGPIEPGRQRVARERQRCFGCDRARAGSVPRPERAEDEPDVGSCELRAGDLAGLELPCGAHQLDAAERSPSFAGREQKHAAGTDQAGCSSHGLGETIRRKLTVREVADREAGSRELGGQRLRTADHRPDAQHSILVGDPDRDRVRTRHLDGRLAKRLERIVEPVLAGRAPPRRGERLEPLLGDPIHFCIQKYSSSTCLGLEKSPSRFPARARRGAGLRPAGAARRPGKRELCSRGMAEPARRPEMVDESLELDPVAVQRAYRLHRARRRHHRNRQRETKRAKLRFWVVLLVLVAASVYLSIVIWHQIERTFGSIGTILRARGALRADSA